METTKKQIKYLFFVIFSILMIIMAMPTKSRADDHFYASVYAYNYAGDSNSSYAKMGRKLGTVPFKTYEFKVNPKNGAGAYFSYRTAYCLDQSRVRPKGNHGVYYERTSIDQYNGTVTPKIHAIFSAGVADYEDKTGTNSAHLNAFVASTGINVDYYELEIATQLAIWAARYGSISSSLNEYYNVAQAWYYLYSLQGFPEVIISGNPNQEVVKEESDYRIYGPYTASFTGVVIDGKITLSGIKGDAEKSTEISTSVDGTYRTSLNVSNNATFYVKVYSDSSYDGKRIPIAKARVDYFKSHFCYAEATDYGNVNKVTANNSNKKYTTGGMVYSKEGSYWSDEEGYFYDPPLADSGDDYQRMIIFDGDDYDHDEKKIEIDYIPSKGSITINKQSNKNSEALTGAVFEVVASQENAFAEVNLTNAEQIQTTTPNAIRFRMTSGSCKIEKLELCGYTIKEIEAPNVEYVLDSTEVPVTLEAGNSSASHTFVNKQKAILEVIKKDGSNNDLAGATFSLSGDTSEAIVEGADVISNDGSTLVFKMTSSKATIKCLKFASYTLKETSAPSDEYTMDLTSSTVTFTEADNKKEVTKTNLKKSYFNFYKVDENGKNLVGAQFELKPNMELTEENINEIIRYSKNVKDMKWNAENKVFTFTNTADDSSITTEGPNGTDVIATQISHLPQGSFTITETKAAKGYIKEEKSMTITVTNDGKCGFKLGTLVLSTNAMGFVNTKIALDLGLEKWVSKVEDATSSDKVKKYVDRNTYDNDVEKRTGDIYVKEGDIVTYTIRIFNHGNVDATATKIVDNVPAGLEFIADNAINQAYGWKVAEDGKIYTDYLASQNLIEKHHVGASTAHDGLNYNSNANRNVAKSCKDCKYADVKISFKVKNFEGIKRIINVAEITEYVSEYDAGYIKQNGTSNDLWEGYKAVDVDSTPANHPEHDFEKAEEERLASEKETETQEGQEGNQEQEEKVTDSKTTRNEYKKPGQEQSNVQGAYYREDDEDIAVIIPANFDLALEKWVSKVIRTESDDVVSERKYEDRNTLDNNVENRAGDIIVRTGDTVVYTIRIYNQGNIDGYAEKIMDSNPDGLEFLPDNEINKKFGWEKGEDGKIYTSFLSKENGEKLKEEIAKQESNKKDEEANSQEVTNASNEETTSQGTTNNTSNEGTNTQETTNNTSNDETNTQETANNTSNEETTSQEATNTSNEETESDMEEKLFNEMYKDGTMLKKHDEYTQHIGKNFENGEYKPNSCEKCDYKDIQIAFKVGKTVKENKESITRIINLAEIVEDRTSVTEKNIVDGEVKEVVIEDLPDIDSTPNNYIGDFEEGRTREDDEDIAVIVPEIFDLALQKWITSYEITVDGQTSTVETTQNYDSTIDEKTGSKLVKIDLDAKKLDSTIIKVKYGIRVVNEGTIPGYVKELTDYIPVGTEFFAEDNKNEVGKAYWVVSGEGTIATSEAYEDKMNTLMQPGDSQIFYVTLRWINNEENMGLKNNIVEISKDYNEWNVPDIDSDPHNVVDRLQTKDWEDDEDEVPFLLTVKTGEWMIYFGITFTVLLVALGAAIVIKKKAAQRI